MLKNFFILCLITVLPALTISCSTSHTHPPPLRAGEIRAESSNPGVWFAKLFRDYISAVDGDRCPSVPTCSSYSAEVFRRHGFFKGWIMTVDRLIRESDEGDYSPLVQMDGRVRILDPPESNYIWRTHEN